MNEHISSPCARICRLGSVALAIATLASQSQAATATASLNVSASVVASCTISVVGVSQLTFGTYAPSGANATDPLEVNGTLTYNCTSGSSAYITLGQGLNPAVGTEGSPARRLASGINRMNYQVYYDSQHQNVWGNTPTTGFGVSANGTDQTVTVYGRIAQGQSVAAGTYSDTLGVTITY